MIPIPLGSDHEPWNCSCSSLDLAIALCSVAVVDDVVDVVAVVVVVVVAPLTTSVV